MANGVVYLVGAGPGDPGLMTVTGWQLIRTADIILYDGLCNEAILRWARKDCVLQCVGKRGHGGHWTQKQIDDLIVDSARKYARVVRLKGGDTSVFARTTEEVERLATEGIPFRIVPGLTVALAASAYTGIPITHRDWSSSVALVTGQLQSNDGCTDTEEPLNWSGLAQFPGTLVMYMGVRRAKEWSQQLIAAGKPPTTPVAMIRRCSWPDQQVLRCELAQVAETLAVHPDFRPPIISIIGDVVQAETPNCWFTAQPLFGQTWVITSPYEQASKLEDRIRELGGQPILSPALHVVDPVDWDTVDASIASMSATDWIVFSSSVGVSRFFHRVSVLGKDSRIFGRTRLAAVGQATADTLRTYGLHCDLVPDGEAGAEGLSNKLLPLVNDKRVVIVRSPEGRRVLEERLAGVATQVHVAVAYRQMPVSAWDEEVLQVAQASSQSMPSQSARHPTWWTATSSNIATQACRLLGREAADVAWLSISPAVTETLRSLGSQHVLTSASPDFASMIQTAIDWREASLQPPPE